VVPLMMPLNLGSDLGASYLPAFIPCDFYAAGSGFLPQANWRE